MQIFLIWGGVSGGGCEDLTVAGAGAVLASWLIYAIIWGLVLAMLRVGRD